MTDLEMTKLCAAAMGYTIQAGDKVPVRCVIGGLGFWFRPLTDDAQAMALVKRFDIAVRRLHLPNDRGWFRAELRNAWDTVIATADWRDLNRAIVECVAKMVADGPMPEGDRT